MSSAMVTGMAKRPVASAVPDAGAVPPETEIRAFGSLLPATSKLERFVGEAIASRVGDIGGVSSCTITTTVSTELPARVTRSSLRASSVSVTAIEKDPSPALVPVAVDAPPVMVMSALASVVPVSVIGLSAVGEATGSTRTGTGSELS